MKKDIHFEVNHMKPIKISFDKKGNTLNVWFDDPQKEAISEEVVLIKDKKGKVICFEVLNYLSQSDLKDVKNLSVKTEILA